MHKLLLCSAKLIDQGICPRATPDNGGARRDRTDDLKLAKLPLSQLSYGPVIIIEVIIVEMPQPGAPRQNGMVGLGRVELPTSRLSGVRSNHLSYRPQFQKSLNMQPGMSVYFAEERETKVAMPATMCRKGPDWSQPFVLKSLNRKQAF